MSQMFISFICEGQSETVEFVKHCMTLVQVNRINVKEVLLYSRCINFKDLTVNMVHNTLVIQCDENIIVHV